MIVPIPHCQFKSLSARKKARIARVFLLIWVMNLMSPLIGYGLTSGPAQPETQAFRPAGILEMVDLSTGDFKYNIPLMDIDGYPLNLNYQSGVGIDDEATWVGLGWNLNVGAINRQLRGIADDAKADEIETEHYTKPKITIGGKLTGKLEIKGKGKQTGVARGSLSVGIFSDNYTGLGAEVGANAGISLSMLNDGDLTAGLGLGINSSTASGAGMEVSPSLNMAIGDKKTSTQLLRSGINFGTNSRSGTKALTLSAGYSNQAAIGKLNLNSGLNSSSSVISYNTEPIMPGIAVPYKSSYGSISFDVGPAEAIFFAGGGGTGYVNVRKVRDNSFTKKAYGFLYADRAKDDDDGVMDFIREKDNPVIPELPNLAIPIQLPDLFSYTSQNGSGQFRLHRGTIAFGDNLTEEKSNVTTGGGDIGFGFSAVHIGGTLFRQESKTTSRRWKSENQYLTKGDAQSSSNTEPPTNEAVYFKIVGEKNQQNPGLNQHLQNNLALKVKLGGMTSTPAFITKTSQTVPITGDFKNTRRQIKRTTLSYLTAEQAVNAALDEKIEYYEVNDITAIGTKLLTPKQEIVSKENRNGGNRRSHHFSEITVNQDDGKRMVYGIPVYNTRQEEYSFAIGTEKYRDRGIWKGDYQIASGTKNLVKFDMLGSKPNHKKGIDHYYHKETQSAYASSFLLTAVLSPDYVDRGARGISPDDAGTAIKFNYSRVSGYQWRTPFGKGSAIVNRGLMADPDDDKASIIYGKKDLAYIHSIENKSRTQIAYFITADRDDALGVKDWLGEIDPSVRQRCLKEIRLYATLDGEPAKLVKVVKFDYTYELCPNTPNSIAANAGKLTLKRVWFEYGDSDKGKHHPYVFTYNQLKDGNAVGYSSLSTDRWGTYKPDTENPSLSGVVNQNDLYPYSNQDSVEAAVNAGIWHLSQIELPTGGKIGLTYESDDYAYVQNKRAMEMVHFDCLIKADKQAIDTAASDALRSARGLRVKLHGLPSGLSSLEQTRWFKNTYLDGSEYLYTKLYVRLATRHISTRYASSKAQEYDFVPCYAKVKSVLLDGDYANILFEDINAGGGPGNPVLLAAWQRLKNDYPRYGSPGFESRAGDDENVISSVKRAVKAVVSAIESLEELRKNFFEKAYEKRMATSYNHQRSFIRLVKDDGKKMGGGVRVQMVQISDEWTSMAAGSTASEGAPVNYNYGQYYSYTTTQNGQIISSGVASYEPSIGEDENPLKLPLPYLQKIKGASDNYFSMEEPFGESLYPAPVVVYSKVTVTDLDRNHKPDPLLRTGFIENEFYTAKDFPVRTERLDIQRQHTKSSAVYTFISSSARDMLALSQGFSIELNDMHGKPKAVNVYNQSKSKISSVEYFYNTEPAGADGLRLKNMVDVIRDNGVVENEVLGRDVDFYTDMREQVSENVGVSLQAGADIFKIPPFVAALPHWPGPPNSEYKLFRSVCAVKVVQYYGFVDKIVKTENGSSISVENLAYDGITGEAVVTKTQNEFNQDIYSVNLPAYWAYRGMGGAYQNLGVILQNLTSNGVGAYASLLQPGDELVDVGTPEKPERYWVIETAGSRKLVNKEGKIFTGTLSLAKIVRSGYRNLLQQSMGSLVCLRNPIESGKFALSTNTSLGHLKILNASASTYNEYWAPEFPEINQTTTTTTIPTKTVYIWGNISEVKLPKFSKEGWFEWEQSYYTIKFYKSNHPNLKPEFIDENLFRYKGTVLLQQNKRQVQDGGSVFTDSEAYYLSAENDSIIRFLNYPTKRGEFTTGRRIPQEIKTQIEHLPYSSITYYKDLRNVWYETTPGEYRFTFSFSNGLTYKELGPYEYTAQVSTTVNNPINPYYQSFLGNWRPSTSKVYQEERTSNDVFNLSRKGLNIKDAGYLRGFESFWKYSNGWFAAESEKWVTANSITLYDQFGQELENKDALNRYSAAKFHFNGELPSAVASNAMHREIYVNSFEDSALPRFNSRYNEFFQNDIPAKSINALAGANQYTHTGNYSVRMPVSGISLSATIHDKEHKLTSGQYLALNSENEYTFLNTPGLYPRGFEPLPYNSGNKKRYLFNAWVRESTPLSKQLSISLKVNDNTVPLSCKAIVEGWKLIEGIINMQNVSGSSLKISLIPSLTDTYIDDIRIQPFDAHMKSYAYDSKTRKLMAELDENGFATFYEYDNEGSLIRVKKETERGIMTIKESRSSYRRR